MTTLALAAYLSPLILIAAGLFAARMKGPRTSAALTLTHGASVAALAIAVLIVVGVAAHGPVTSPLLGASGLGLQVRLDALSAMMLALTGFVGWIVIRFSATYMDGDDRHSAFMGGLCVTLGAVTFLILSGNLVQLLLGWTATSLAIHRMLLFYRTRPGARLAARKKFLFARIGDVVLIGAAVLMFRAFGTGEIAEITSAAAAGPVPTGALWAACGLAIAALLKSATFPTQGWLTEVMETPTPVSALLHAGIINAGGFLIIRFADLILASAPSMHLLAILGGASAVIGSLVMITQTSIKVSLAWSTVAQMGFMLLQCGMGAFTAAALHIVAHSLYKAHAFLTSGSVADQARAMPKLASAPTLPMALAALGLAVAMVAVTGWLFGVTLESKPAIVTLGAILVMGLALLMLTAAAAGSAPATLARTAAGAAAVAVTYFTLQWGAETLLVPTLPAAALPGPATALLMGVFVAVFTLTALIQILAPSRRHRPGWRRAYVALRNGLYTNAMNNRIVGVPAPKTPA